MRTIMLAVAATTLTVPALPTVASAQTYYNGKVWRDSQGRLRCKRPNGTTGLIVGGAAGALVGRAVDTHGSRATGTIVGLAAGALIGREIDRNRRSYRCRYSASEIAGARSSMGVGAGFRFGPSVLTH